MLRAPVRRLGGDAGLVGGTGLHGQGLGGQLGLPRAALLWVGDFLFLGGDAEAPVARALAGVLPRELANGVALAVPQNESWLRLLEEAHGQRSKPITRYAIRKEPGAFDPGKLRANLEKLPQGFTLEPIDERLYHALLELDWARDFCAQFGSWEEYAAHGCGFVAIKDGQVAAGASSYTWYRGGIEIEIDTKTEYRRQGLALCRQPLLLHCLGRALPSWDAATPISVALAGWVSLQPRVPLPGDCRAHTKGGLGMKQRKKLLCLVAAAALCLGLAACGARASTEPAVAPYDMTEDQEELLSLLGLTDKAMVFSFQGPEEAAELTAHTYVLEDGAWVENGGVSITRDTAEAGPFQGEFALVYREDRSMELYLHHQGGVVSFSSEPVAFPGETLASLRGGLQESAPAPLGEEIPVALFVEDSGTALQSLGPEVYFTPGEAAGYDVVQAVTLEFRSR
ncbi:MAG: GNAT family N-acetyltransferase [Acutalibacter sp.]